MPIAQTIEIPPSRRVQLPLEVPVGRAKIVIFPEPAAKPETKKKTALGPELPVSPSKEKRARMKAAVEAAWGSAKDSSLTSDRFLETKRKDLSLENAFDPMRRSKQG